MILKAYQRQNGPEGGFPFQLEDKTLQIGRFDDTRIYNPIDNHPGPPLRDELRG